MVAAFHEKKRRLYIGAARDKKPLHNRASLASAFGINMPSVSPVIDGMADGSSSNHSFGQQSLLISSRSSDVLLAASEQLGLVSWMPPVK